MSRGPYGDQTIWEEGFENGLDTGIWTNLQNAETTQSNQNVSNWPWGTQTRTTLPSGTGYGGVGRAARFELRPGDIGPQGGSGCRSEISGVGKPWEFREGDERWLQMRLKFNDPFTIHADSGFYITPAQWHAGSGSPPLALGFTDNDDFHIGGTHSTATPKIILTASEFRARLGTWMDLNVHWMNSIDPAIGFVEVHLDGALVVPKTYMATMSSSKNYLKIGQYRAPINDTTNVMWVDDMRLTSGSQVGGGEALTGLVGSPSATELTFTSTATSITVPTPAGAAIGETLVAAVAHNSPTAPAAPAGWTVSASAPSVEPVDNVSAAIFHQKLAATPPANYTFPIATGAATAVIHRVAGLPDSPLDIASVSAYSQSGNTVTLPTSTTTTADVLTLSVATQRQISTPITEPPETVQVYESTGTGRRLSLAGEVRPTAGDIGLRTFSSSSLVEWAAARVHFRTSATGAPTVDAGADATIVVGDTFTRTASENDHGQPIEARAWTVASGPERVGEVLSTTTTVSFTPSVAGSFVLQYAAENINGIGTDTTTLTVNSTAQVGTSPTLYARWAGMPESGIGRVTVNTSAVKARLKVGTNADLTTDVVWGPYATPNAQGDCHLTVGLPQRALPTKYYYRVAMVNAEGGEFLDGASTQGSFWTAPTGRASLTFGFGSCHRLSDNAAITAMANRDDHLAMITGDLYYADGSGESLSNFRAKFDGKIRGAFKDLLATRGTLYCPDDHDGMYNDTTNAAHPTAWTNYNTVYREKVASPSLPGSKGIYWSRPWGDTYRIILLDTRSFANPGTTVLGSTQKQWLKDTLNAMVGTTEDVAIIVQGAVWNYSSGTSGEDGWEGTLSERNEVGDFIANWRATNNKHAILLAGDMHAVAAGIAMRAGCPLYHAAPLNNNASQKGSNYSDGPYPSSGTTQVQQYGRVTLTPHADGKITSAFVGYSSNNTVRVSRTDTFQGQVPSTLTGGVHVGSAAVSSMYVGSAPVQAAYVGSTQVF